MTIKEIKDILGIDITEVNKKLPFVVLKALYIENRIIELKDFNKNHKYEIICKELNIKKSNILYALKQVEKYKIGETTKILFNAFKSKEKHLINDYYKALEDRNRRSVYLYDLNKRNIRNNSIKLNNLQVADYLKANSINISRFWDRLPKYYTDKEWLELRSFNSKMFDSYGKKSL